MVRRFNPKVHFNAMPSLNSQNRSLALAAVVASLVLPLAFPSRAAAQPIPTLTNVPAVYLKQGDSVELTLTGQNLGDVTGVLVPNPRGLSAGLLEAEELSSSEKSQAASADKGDAKAAEPDAKAAAGGAQRRGRRAAAAKRATTDSKARVKLAVPSDAALGDREIRLVTPMGVTAPLVVTVGQIPSSADKEPNNAADAAQEVQLPAALVGRIDAPGDQDYYRFEAKKGQHLIFDVHAGRLGSPLQAVVVVQDEAGRELPHADEFHGGDPMAVFDVPADGRYDVHVRDLQYRGGGDYRYRIDAGPIPYVESLLPSSGRRGQKVEVTAVGHNLGDGGGERITLDLSTAEPGKLPVRAKTPLGLSNEVPFVVTDVAQVTEQEPNDKPEQANAVPLPSEITGVLQREGDEDFYKFQVATRQQVTIAVEARRSGSPVDALLTLKNAKGDVIEQNNGAAEAEARIARPLEPGEYVLSVRDLTFAGGSGYGYRISLAAGGLPPDFAVRFMPDAIRLARGGNARVWCEVTRSNGYKGDVTVALDGLPAGVTVSGPVVMTENTSGLFTLAAAPDAALGTAPIQLKASALVGGLDATRAGEPELNNRVVQQAYLTVLEAAPVTVDAVALLKPEQLRDYGKQVQELYAKVNTQTPQLDAAQAEWEKHATASAEWKMLEPEKLASASNVPLNKQPDGSVLVGGSVADRDTYTVTATTDLKGITAVRLEVLPDDSLPGKGPGRAPNGNFVLSKFAATAAPKDDPSKAQPLALSGARATFEQVNYPASASLDAKPGAGWALSPELGKPQVAYFFLQSPFAGSDAGMVLTFTLDQQFGMLHTLGKFRLSVTTDPDVKTKQGGKPVPAPILAIVQTASDKRTPEQKAQLATYYRSIAPELAGDRARLEALRSAIGPYAEIARLEALLGANTPALDAERKEWEQTALTGGWSPVDVADVKSANGTTLTKEPDGSVSASGNSPPTDTYTLVASTPLKQITAVRIEALPDERFPGNGPGRGANGNFILSRLQVTAQPKADDGKPGAATPVEFRSARATFEQQGWQAAGALDDRNDTGWGVAPNTGRPVSAAFTARVPVAGDGGAVLTLLLEQQSTQLQHTLGRFRVWVTGSATPEVTPSLPPDVAAALRVPADKRNDEQKAALAAYQRTLTPSLQEVRERLAELKSKSAPLPLTVARNRPAFIPVPVARTGATPATDVQITLEGFSAGRDPGTKMPAPIVKNLLPAPLTIKADEAFGRLNFRVNPNSELGTRMVVIRAETKVGNDTYVQYSPAFPLTVTEK